MSAPVLRAGVIGVGAFGRHHARIFRELEQAQGGVRLVGLVDIDPVGPREVSDRLGVPLVPHVAALPEPVDVVTIAVPTLDHRAVAEPLLRRGVHCLVEKPLAGSSADAEALMSAAKAGNAILQVGLVERFNPVMAALDRLGAPPAFVEVHRLAPYPNRSVDVGVVMDMMIHDLDLLNLVVGEEAERVEAVGVPVVGPHEDLANARITFASGCVANVTASRVSLHRMRRFRIFSRDGYLALDYDTRQALLVVPPRGSGGAGAPVASWERVRLVLEESGGDIDRALERLHREAFEAPALPKGFLVEPLEIGDAEPLREEIAALVDAIRQGRRPRVGGGEGLRALRLAERILEDLRARPIPGGR